MIQRAAASTAFNILFIGLLGTHTAYSTSNRNSGCDGCVGCVGCAQLRHLRSTYCSLGFWGPILHFVLRIGALAALAALAARSCTSCAQLRFRQRSCVSANAAKQTVTPAVELGAPFMLWWDVIHWNENGVILGEF